MSASCAPSCLHPCASARAVHTHVLVLACSSHGSCLGPLCHSVFGLQPALGLTLSCLPPQFSMETCALQTASPFSRQSCSLFPAGVMALQRSLFPPLLTELLFHRAKHEKL